MLASHVSLQTRHHFNKHFTSVARSNPFVDNNVQNDIETWKSGEGTGREIERETETEWLWHWSLSHWVPVDHGHHVNRDKGGKREVPAGKLE